MSRRVKFGPIFGPKWTTGLLGQIWTKPKFEQEVIVRLPKTCPMPKNLGRGLEPKKATEAQTFFRLDSWSGVTLINFTFFIFSIRLQLNCFLNMLFSITSICSLASIYNYSLPINLGCMKRTKLSTDYLLTYTFNSPKFTINQ